MYYIPSSLNFADFLHAAGFQFCYHDVALRMIRASDVPCLLATNVISRMKSTVLLFRFIKGDFTYKFERQGPSNKTFRLMNNWQHRNTRFLAASDETDLSQAVAGPMSS